MDYNKKNKNKNKASAFYNLDSLTFLFIASSSINYIPSNVSFNEKSIKTFRYCY